MDKRQQRILIEQKEKLARDAAKLEQLWAGLDGEEVVAPTYTSRYEVPPPEPKDKTKYNKHNLVDIETFIKHPYFLDLKPYPWQILALKLFYAGSEGNTVLEINDSKKEETTGCDSCVWKYIVDNEIASAEQIEAEENFQTYLKPFNSRCLKCSRCPLKTRLTRLNYEIDNASDIDTENLLREIVENEPDDLFQSEIDLIDEIPDEAVKLQIKNKLRNKFQELVLIIGRRGSKSFMTVTIALYELYRLLSMKHPQKILNLPDFMEIHMLNVAKNEEQAKDSIFTPMKSMAVSSPFFQKYIGVDNALEMKFKTEKDLEENERRKAKGYAELDGTIVMKCGNASAGGLVGKTCWCIILDELAAMTGDNPNSGLDKKLYDELTPSIATFGKEGKIISLSNPKGPFGQLFTLYNTRLEDKMTLVLKLPTWHINANIDKLWLEDKRKNDPVEFNMQFGAEFGNNSQDPYLSSDDVNYAFDNCEQIKRLEEREPGAEYYCHVDPSNRSDYYAIAVVQAIPTGDRDIQGKAVKSFRVVHLQFWAPLKMKQPVPVREVEEYLMQLNSKFKFKQISFDQWGSLETLEKLKANGLPVVLKVFNKEYKDKIYLKLLEVFRDKRITFYKISSGQVRDLNNKIMDINEIPEARNQFMFLQKKWRNGRQQIEALTGYKDDICDAVAAAVYEADADMIAYKSLPRARIAYTGRGFR
jgi:hypothetical protein